MDEENEVITGINEKDIAKANEILRRYKEGKANLEQKIVENEQWWKLRHWEYMRKGSSKIAPVSAWLFNSIANKHADAMDNYPEPSVLARAMDDEETAAVLTKVLPTLLEYNEYEQTYSDVWWYKLKQGTGVKGIFWNPDKENGLGDVDIKKIDLLNLFWEPGISDIQDSPNLFHVSLVNTEDLKNEYPGMDFAEQTFDLTKYVYDDNINTDSKSVVVDWYYKKRIGVKTALHYVKYSDGNILYASENDENYRERGFYDHGMYPFVFDTLFVEEGTPVGFGYIDVMKSPEEYIDRLNKCIMENALATCKKRFIVSDQTGLNEEDFADFDKTIIKTPSNNLGDNSFREITSNPMSSVYVTILQNKIDELKETSGNRDFSQGGTSNGVTAASAISALMEAGSKLSRDMIASGYRAFTKECYMVLELVRQFYNEPRCFRITGQGTAPDYISLDNTGMIARPQGNDMGLDLGTRLPVFDIKVSASKKATYSRMAQNELAIQLFNLGVFNPQLADQAMALLEIMDFDGKEKITEIVKTNGGMYAQMMEMQQQMTQMAQIIDSMTGENLTGQVSMNSGPGMTQPQSQTPQSQTQVEKSADRARSSASIGGTQ